MSFKYRTNDWKAIIELIDKYYHEQSRTKSKSDRRESNKK